MLKLFAVHVSSVFPRIGVHGSYTENLLPSSYDLSLVNFLL